MPSILDSLPSQFPPIIMYSLPCPMQHDFLCSNVLLLSSDYSCKV
uniref:Uncharacterized protein n=1 Tax=Arundo donax TaxID=35708 RepID=A0A0A9FI48_ARUDO